MTVSNEPRGRFMLRTWRCCGNLWELLYNDSPRWHWRRRWRPKCDVCGYHLPAPEFDGGQKPKTGTHLHTYPQV
jgi:hypothetical protein